MVHRSNAFLFFHLKAVWHPASVHIDINCVNTNIYNQKKWFCCKTCALQWHRATMITKGLCLIVKKLNIKNDVINCFTRFLIFKINTVLGMCISHLKRKEMQSLNNPTPLVCLLITETRLSFFEDDVLLLCK